MRAGVVMAVMGMASLAFGETPAAQPAPASAGAAGPTSDRSAEAPAKAAPPGGAILRDPSGKAGISPAMEAIAAGDEALLARDFPAAAVQYQQAITLEPRKALGHLRMAALHLSLGELDQATVVLETAETLTGGDAWLTVQTLALKAMLAERKGALADANLAWSAYALLGRAGGPALGDALMQQAVAATCAERKSAVAVALERQAASAKVRERIEKGLAEAEPSGTPPKR
jgi:hypothetical protein